MYKIILPSLILLLINISCTRHKLEISWERNNPPLTIFHVYYWEGVDTLSCPIHARTDVNLLHLYKVSTTLDTTAVKRILGRRVEGLYVRVGVMAQIGDEYSELAITPFLAYDDIF